MAGVSGRLWGYVETQRHMVKKNRCIWHSARGPRSIRALKADIHERAPDNNASIDRMLQYIPLS